MQYVILLPFFSKFLKSCSNGVTLVFFIILSEGFEVLFSLIHMPDYLYRLLAIRYLFLIWLGWQWVKDGVKINRLTSFLSFISLISIVYFEYFSLDNEPLFFSTSWKYHRWPCYFFVAYGLTALLYLVWNKLKVMKSFRNVIVIIASASYEIFLIQMCLVYLFKYKSLSFIVDTRIQYLLWIIIVWSISLIGGIGWKQLKSYIKPFIHDR